MTGTIILIHHSTFFRLSSLISLARPRKGLIELMEKMNAEMFRAYLEATEPEAKGADFEVKLKKELENQFHAATLLDQEFVMTISTVLKKHIWIILKNTTGKVLYTSDNPVARHGHIKHPVRSFSGLGSRGIEIAFPLSPEYLLSLAEAKVFGDIKKKDGKMWTLTDKENVTFYNSLQVLQSYRYLFASEPDFDLAESMCDKNPNLRNPNKARVISVQPSRN